MAHKEKENKRKFLIKQLSRTDDLLILFCKEKI